MNWNEAIQQMQETDRPTVAPQQCGDNKQDKAEAMLSEVASLIASWRAGHVKYVSVMSRLDRMFPGLPSVTTTTL